MNIFSLRYTDVWRERERQYDSKKKKVRSRTVRQEIKLNTPCHGGFPFSAWPCQKRKGYSVTAEHVYMCILISRKNCVRACILLSNAFEFTWFPSDGTV